MLSTERLSCASWNAAIFFSIFFPFLYCALPQNWAQVQLPSSLTATGRGHNQADPLHANQSPLRCASHRSRIWGLMGDFASFDVFLQTLVLRSVSRVCSDQHTTKAVIVQEHLQGHLGCVNTWPSLHAHASVKCSGCVELHFWWNMKGREEKRLLPSEQKIVNV